MPAKGLVPHYAEFWIVSSRIQRIIQLDQKKRKVAVCKRGTAKKMGVMGFIKKSV